MFIIKRENLITPPVIKYMSRHQGVTGSELFGQSWIATTSPFNIFLNLSVMPFPTYQAAEDFITKSKLVDPMLLNLWLVLYDVYICELDNNGDIIKETKYSSSTLAITNQQSTPTLSNGTAGTDTDDGIDYDTPGEALKAYKRGKAVDWKRLAEKKV